MAGPDLQNLCGPLFRFLHKIRTECVLPGTFALQYFDASHKARRLTVLKKKGVGDVA